MTRYQVVQTTTYTYEGLARQSISQCKLKPITNRQQRVLAFTLEVDPPTRSYEHLDYWGNHTATFYHWEPHAALTIRSMSTVEVEREPYTWTHLRQHHEPFSPEDARSRYAEFLHSTRYTSVSPSTLDRVSSDAWAGAANTFEFAVRLTQHLYQRFSYETGNTTVKTTAEEFCQTGKGVCQDFAHLMLALCRARGIPSRYVSGYIDTGQDAAVRGDAATHAWVELLMPGRVWVGFDPTNNQIVSSQYVQVAVGRDYQDIVPTRGVYIGGGQTLTVSVSVQRLGPAM